MELDALIWLRFFIQSLLNPAELPAQTLADINGWYFPLVNNYCNQAGGWLGWNHKRPQLKHGASSSTGRAHQPYRESSKTTAF